MKKMDNVLRDRLKFEGTVLDLQNLLDLQILTINQLSSLPIIFGTFPLAKID